MELRRIAPRLFGAWQTRDMGERDDHAILKRLYLMPECEREATNYLCERADGMVFIEHAMGAQWGISRAQNGRINDDFSDGDVDFEDEEHRLSYVFERFTALSVNRSFAERLTYQVQNRFQVNKFPYGMEAFSAVSDFDYVKLWGGLTGFMSAFGINRNDNDAVLELVN